MSYAICNGRLIRQRRDRVFGLGRTVPMDRNGKARLMARAKALMRATEAGKHYGDITAKAYAVLQALAWTFHNAGTGACFPSYEAISEAAGCARSTVAEAIKALETAGLLTWQNRLKRVWEQCADLFGDNGWRRRVVRTSNAYTLVDPKPSKSELLTGTPNQAFLPKNPAGKAAPPDPTSPLGQALTRLGRAISASENDGMSSWRP